MTPEQEWIDLLYAHTRLSRFAAWTLYPLTFVVVAGLAAAVFGASVGLPVAIVALLGAIVTGVCVVARREQLVRREVLLVKARGAFTMNSDGAELA